MKHDKEILKRFDCGKDFNKKKQLQTRGDEDTSVSDLLAKCKQRLWIDLMRWSSDSGGEFGCVVPSLFKLLKRMLACIKLSTLSF